MKRALPLLMLGVAGCTHLPSVNAPAQPELSTATNAALANGWQNRPAGLSAETGSPTSGNAELARLTALALDRSQSLAEARARIAEARARLAAAGARTGPDGSISASARGQRQSENGALPIARFGADRDQILYQVGFDTSWELDLFGGVRAGIEAAGERLSSADADLSAIRLSLAAEVARTWTDFQAARIELAQQRAIVSNLEQVLDHIRRRHSAGDLSHREVDDWAQRVAMIEAGVPSLEARAQAALLALATLTGQPVETEAGLMQTPPALPEFAPPAGLTRAEVIAGRPDIRAAEARLRASVSETAVARAQLYPRIGFSLGGGLQATDLDDLPSASSLFASAGPILSWRIFDRGRIRADIAASSAREEAALRQWEQSVIGAIHDVERAYADMGAADEALSARRDALTAARHADAHAARRFAAGDISRIERLDVARAMLEAEIAVTRAEANAMTARIALNKALAVGA